MKRIYLIVTALIFIVSCVDLDITPTNVFTSEGIFNEAGIKAYMSGMYSRLPMEDFRYDTRNTNGAIYGYFAAIQLSTLCQSTGEIVNGDGLTSTIVAGYWGEGFKIIRQTNTLIQDLPNYPELSEQSKAWIAEAKFIRAYVYFQLAKRYGGLPKILEPQYLDPNDESTLYIARVSHADTYDFILQDLDDAIAGMPEQSEAGRANKYVAAALKSRVALYAATTARYGSDKFTDWEVDGVLLQGIPKSKATGYFRQAWDAAKLLEGKYELHRANADKTVNYVEVWEKCDNNRESIWLRRYEFLSFSHSFNWVWPPPRMCVSYGARGGGPTLDWIELFDGLPIGDEGHLHAFDNDGNFLVYDGCQQLWNGAEPRLRANLLIPGQVYCEVKLDLRAGIIDKKFDPAVDKFKKFTIDNGSHGGKFNVATYYNTNDYTASPFLDGPNRIVWWTSYDARTQPESDLYEGEDGLMLYKNGLDGPRINAGTNTASGTYSRKYMDITMPIAENFQYTSTQSWIEIRYAEVLLNRAEAAIELAQSGETNYNGVDMLQDAFICINDVRDRAGATLLAGVAELSTNEAFTNWTRPGPKGKGGFVEAPNRALQILRVERYKELAFEHKIYWDLRRWFTFDTQLRDYRRRMILPFMFAKGATRDGTFCDGKYIYDSKASEHQTGTSTFSVNSYYEGIPAAELKNNPLLQKNRNQ